MKRAAPDPHALAGWDPGAKDAEVEVECDALTGGHYRVSCAATERAWIGVRGRPGVVSGAYCFEVKVSDGLVRVGWSCGTASLSLGTDGEGFGFGGTGKKSHMGKFLSYGVAFGEGDVVSCCVDRRRREISFGVNDQHLGRAFSIPRDWDGVPLFPALCAREAFRATGYFGCPEHPKVPYGCGFWPLGGAYASDVVESGAGPPSERLGAIEEPAQRAWRTGRLRLAKLWLGWTRAPHEALVLCARRRSPTAGRAPRRQLASVGARLLARCGEVARPRAHPAAAGVARGACAHAGGPAVLGVGGGDVARDPPGLDETAPPSRGPAACSGSCSPRALQRSSFALSSAT